MIWLILLALGTGFMGGYYLLGLESKSTLDLILMNALNVIVFIGGLEIGGNKEIVKKMLRVKTLGLILAVPLGCIVGSIIGGGLVGALIGVSWRDAILVSSGMGWYSFSSVVISAMYSNEVGTVAFIANAFRETLSFVLVPVAARFTNLACVSIGGASTMDSTLPVILKYTNMQIGVIGFINGVLLTLIVPFLISFLLP